MTVHRALKRKTAEPPAINVVKGCGPAPPPPLHCTHPCALSSSRSTLALPYAIPTLAQEPNHGAACTLNGMVTYRHITLRCSRPHTMSRCTDLQRHHATDSSGIVRGQVWRHDQAIGRAEHSMAPATNGRYGPCATTATSSLCWASVRSQQRQAPPHGALACALSAPGRPAEIARGRLQHERDDHAPPQFMPSQPVAHDVPLQ